MQLIVFPDVRAARGSQRGVEIGDGRSVAINNRTWARCSVALSSFDKLFPVAARSFRSKQVNLVRYVVWLNRRTIIESLTEKELGRFGLQRKNAKIHKPRLAPWKNKLGEEEDNFEHVRRMLSPLVQEDLRYQESAASCRRDLRQNKVETFKE